ncbi:MAG: mycofactocin system glycosyltransferase [Actinobacteria bacterium]|nr:mycofactocin system glycosyltransferase [Actinomycetota bacterium]
MRGVLLVAEVRSHRRCPRRIHRDVGDALSRARTREHGRGRARQRARGVGPGRATTARGCASRIGQWSSGRSAPSRCGRGRAHLPALARRSRGRVQTHLAGAAVTRYRPDSSWWRTRRRSTDGSANDTVVAGSPLRLFRLGPAGSKLADALEATGDAPDGSQQLVNRFVDAGAIHPIPDQAIDLAAVTVVIPARNERHVDLQMLVSSVSSAAKVIVVDDGSPLELAPIDGALVVRREHSGGPAAARNTGAALADTDFVLFIDADTCWNDDAVVLFAHFTDSRVAAVAPRVRSIDGPSLLERYETAESPLDLGPEAARVRPNSRVSYVPAAALAVRRSTFEQLGGFDESFRYGEDVDFVWRAVAAGHVVRYEPLAEVQHRPRGSFEAWIRQRVGYGSAAASLAARHRGAVTPLKINRWSAGAWALTGWGRPDAGVLVATSSWALLLRKLGDAPDRRGIALRLAGRGNLHAGRLVASAVTRAWLPIAIVLALFFPRARRALAVALTVPSAVHWISTKPNVDLSRYVLLKALDDASYCTGVWRGLVKSRASGRWGAITPRFD